jgi:hypothetical protein
MTDPHANWVVCVSQLRAIEHFSGSGAHDLATEVHVECHRRVRVAELIGNLAWREPRLVQSSGDRLAEGLRGAPPAGLEPATCRIDLERIGQCWLMTKTVVLQGIQRVLTLTDVGCHRRFSMSKRCIDLEIGTK